MYNFLWIITDSDEQNLVKQNTKLLARKKSSKKGRIYSIESILIFIYTKLFLYSQYSHMEFLSTFTPIRKFWNRMWGINVSVWKHISTSAVKNHHFIKLSTKLLVLWSPGIARNNQDRISLGYCRLSLEPHLICYSCFKVVNFIILLYVYIYISHMC